jgi:hypothetical protein
LRSDTPTLTTAGATNNGTIYGGPAWDGSASAFVFGSTSTFDTQYDFDGRFGVNYEPPFPAAGVVVFKFRNLRITGGRFTSSLAGPPTWRSLAWGVFLLRNPAACSASTACAVSRSRRKAAR